MKIKKKLLNILSIASLSACTGINDIEIKNYFYIEKSASDISIILENHIHHSDDKFELTMTGTNSSIYYSLIIQCSCHYSEKQCMYFLVGKTSKEINNFLDQHATHLDDEILLESASTSYSTYYSAIVSCKE